MKELKINNVKFSTIAKRYGTLAGWVVLCIVFSALAPKSFPTMKNFLTIFRQIAMLAILSMGLTFVLITKRSDLSIGYSTSFLGIAVAACMVKFGMPIWAAILVTIGLGALIGLVNGVVIAYFGVPDFIGSLGVGYLVMGLNQAFTKGHPISNLPSGFGFVGATKFLGVIPSAVIVMIIVLVICYLILAHTRLGRYVYAIGDNQEATMMSGVNVKNTIVWSYVICGISAAITAVVLTSRLGSAHPQAAEDYLLNAIAAVYLGGTAFKDGEPNLAGTVLGAVIIGTMANGLTILDVSYYYQDVATGLIILAAVMVTSVQRMHKK